MTKVVFTVDGVQIPVVMGNEEAQVIFRNWMTGTTSLKGPPRVGDMNCAFPWGVQMDRVGAMQLFDLEKEQQLRQQAAAQQSLTPYQPPPGVNHPR